MRARGIVFAFAVLAACRDPAVASPASGTDAAVAVAPSAKPIPTLDAAAKPSPPEPADAWDPHLDYSSVGPKAVVLGAHLVDAATGKRLRTIPPGNVMWADDNEHLSVVTATKLVIGRMSTADEDYTGTFAAGDGNPTIGLAKNGRAAIFATGPNTLVVDAKKRTTTILSSAPDGGAMTSVRFERTISSDGARIAWIDGGSANVRDLDSGTTISWKAGGKEATDVMIAPSGDVAGALFTDDEFVAVRVPSGEEILRKKNAYDFIVSEDGKTIAWQDFAPKIPQLALFDVAKKKETARVAIGDPDNVPFEKQRFRGACGGGTFHLSSLKGASAELHRDCSLVDILRIDITPGARGAMESHTPAEEADEDQRLEKVCKRAKLATCPQRPYLWGHGEKRIVAPADGKLVIIEVSSGKRVGTLESSESQSTDRDVYPADHGKTIAGIDTNGIARLWSTTTGKVLFEAPAAVPSP
jgi:hypothetical protein